MTVPTITLNDTTSIPQLGFGVFQVPPPETASVVSAALDVGYRHIDTAQMYGNEAGVGEAIAGSGIPRDELYVTTKLSNRFHRPDDVRRSIDESLGALRLDRVDLFLIHWPLPSRYDGDFVSTWRAMAELVEQGKVASVGVSNFQPAHLDRLIDETGVVPAVNQIEVHPYFGNEKARTASLDHGVAVEAWAPLAQGAVVDDPAVVEVAEELGRTPAQVMLRWHIERGDIIFPKSVRPERMRENFALFDFAHARAGRGRLGARPRRGRPARPGPGHVRLDPRLRLRLSLRRARPRAARPRRPRSCPRSAACLR